MYNPLTGNIVMRAGNKVFVDENKLLVPEDKEKCILYNGRYYYPDRNIFKFIRDDNDKLVYDATDDNFIRNIRLFNKCIHDKTPQKIHNPDTGKLVCTLHIAFKGKFELLHNRLVPKTKTNYSVHNGLYYKNKPGTKYNGVMYRRLPLQDWIIPVIMQFLHYPDDLLFLETVYGHHNKMNIPKLADKRTFHKYNGGFMELGKCKVIRKYVKICSPYSFDILNNMHLDMLSKCTISSCKFENIAWLFGKVRVQNITINLLIYDKETLLDLVETIGYKALCNIMHPVHTLHITDIVDDKQKIFEECSMISKYTFEILLDILKKYGMYMDKETVAPYILNIANNRERVQQLSYNGFIQINLPTTDNTICGQEL